MLCSQMGPNFLWSKSPVSKYDVFLRLLPHFSLLLVPSFYAHAYANPDLKAEQAFRWQPPKPLPLPFQNKLARMTNIKRINAHLEQILIHRPVGSTNLKKVGMYIKRVLANLNYSVEIDKFSIKTIKGDKTFRNIIATLNPAANKRLVIACHYESKLFDEFEFLGAVDSAVPCALMLDLAETLHSFTKTIEKSDLSLQLIFFDGEEAFKDWTETDSLYGSRNLASKWQNQTYIPQKGANIGQKMTELDRIDLFVLLDLLGAPEPEIPNYLMYNCPVAYAMMQRIEKDLKSTKILHNMPEFFTGTPGYGVDDDHKPFVERGVRTLHIIPTPFPDVWHRKSDNWDAIDWPTIQNWASILRVFTANYLEMSDTKRENETDNDEL